MYRTGEVNNQNLQREQAESKLSTQDALRFVARQLAEGTEQVKPNQATVQTPQLDGETAVEQLVHSQRPGNVGLGLLKSFMTKAGRMGITLDPQAAVRHLESKENQLLNQTSKTQQFAQILGQEAAHVSRFAPVHDSPKRGTAKKEGEIEGSTKSSDASEEIAAARSPSKTTYVGAVFAILGKKYSGKGGGGGSGFGGLLEEGGSTDGGDVDSSLQKYALLFAESVVEPGQDVKGQLRSLHDKLCRSGMSEGELIALERDIKKVLKEQALQQVREQITFELLSSGTGDKLQRLTFQMGIQSFVEEFFKKKGLGNWDDKDPVGSLERNLGIARRKAIQELQAFLPEELENELIRLTIRQEEDFGHAFKLFETAEKLGMRPQEFVEQKWPARKEDLGLTVFAGDPQAVEAGRPRKSGGERGSDQRQQNAFEATREEEQEILLNRMRAIYMQRALKGDWTTFVTTELKLIQLRNGVIRLGIFTPEHEKQLEREGQLAAKIKAIDILKEKFLEKSTFYDEAGPAYKMVRHGIKAALKTLGRLGVHLSDGDLKQLQDSANTAIHQSTVRERSLAEVAYVVDERPEFDKQYHLLNKLAKRLEKETPSLQGLAETLPNPRLERRVKEIT